MILRTLLVAIAATVTLPALAAESQLCRSQLELLQSRNRLTEDEAANFERQCACLELNERDGQTRNCASDN